MGRSSLMRGAALPLGNPSLHQVGRGYVGTNGPRAQMLVVVERPLAMPLESEKAELGLIAFAAISKEISYGGLTRAVRRGALEYSGAIRDPL